MRDGIFVFSASLKSLGKQAHQEFMAYTPPDDGRKFTELYNVQRLTSPNLDPHAQVCISTIQRMYSVLSGEPIDDSADEVSLNEIQQTSNQAKDRGLDRTEETLTKAELDAARARRVATACAPFDKPELRHEIEAARCEREQLIDHVNLDQVIFADYSAQAEAQAQKVIQSFADYIQQHKDEISALHFFYQQPYQRRGLTFDMIEELHDRLSRPPMMLTTERLWSAYARVQTSQVKGATDRRQLTDLIALVRFAIGLDAELKPFSEQVDKRFQEWIFRHNAQRATAFTPEQTEWLRLMKDHIASSCRIDRDDFDYAGFADKGGLQRVWGVFGDQLDGLMREMNEELVA